MGEPRGRTRRELLEDAPLAVALVAALRSVLVGDLKGQLGRTARLFVNSVPRAEAADESLEVLSGTPAEFASNAFAIAINADEQNALAGHVQISENGVAQIEPNELEPLLASLETLGSRLPEFFDEFREKLITKLTKDSVPMPKLVEAEDSPVVAAVESGTFKLQMLGDAAEETRGLVVTFNFDADQSAYLDQNQNIHVRNTNNLAATALDGTFLQRFQSRVFVNGVPVSIPADKGKVGVFGVDSESRISNFVVTTNAKTAQEINLSRPNLPEDAVLYAIPGLEQSIQPNTEGWVLASVYDFSALEFAQMAEQLASKMNRADRVQPPQVFTHETTGLKVVVGGKNFFPVVDEQLMAEGKRQEAIEQARWFNWPKGGVDTGYAVPAWVPEVGTNPEMRSGELVGFAAESFFVHKILDGNANPKFDSAANAIQLLENGNYGATRPMPLFLEDSNYVLGAQSEAKEYLDLVPEMRVAFDRQLAAYNQSGLHEAGRDLVVVIMHNLHESNPPAESDGYLFSFAFYTGIYDDSQRNLSEVDQMFQMNRPNGGDWTKAYVEPSDPNEFPLLFEIGRYRGTLQASGVVIPGDVAIGTANTERILSIANNQDGPAIVVATPNESAQIDDYKARGEYGRVEITGSSGSNYYIDLTQATPVAVVPEPLARIVESPLSAELATTLSAEAQASVEEFPWLEDEGGIGSVIGYPDLGVWVVRSQHLQNKIGPLQANSNTRDFLERFRAAAAVEMAKKNGVNLTYNNALEIVRNGGDFGFEGTVRTMSIGQVEAVASGGQSAGNFDFNPSMPTAGGKNIVIFQTADGFYYDENPAGEDRIESFRPLTTGNTSNNQEIFSFDSGGNTLIASYFDWPGTGKDFSALREGNLQLIQSLKNFSSNEPFNGERRIILNYGQGDKELFEFFGRYVGFDDTLLVDNYNEANSLLWQGHVKIQELTG